MNRNKKILLGSTVAALGVIIIWFLASDLNKVTGDLVQAYADPELYEQAIALANKNTEAQTYLGTLAPIGNMAILEGETRYSNEHQKVTTTVRVKGTKGNARLDIKAARVNDVWQYRLIRLRIKSPPEKKRTILIREEAHPVEK
ncbi:cytochrome c oxidase assembly factor Coa1 family protein [Altibacter sp. HG106]|uniref:cytochrome c oxidase assembly factor Coa1 family protein n=1 Tax=Altibacter sp. HG106 TaxID=3023937 RepID=UPI002350EA98|nr:cytochrome c oxidase assembly factor Coa1 family protein [Altibacter sp. HG106]MDC7995676.1 cytochrome c oxidase assembly factor Coa1 family protein [Altibacter sp. HG106]